MNHLLGFLFLCVIAIVGYLFMTSSAVLVYERENKPPPAGTLLFDRFECKYFTGLRLVDRISQADTGCPRWIKIP